MKILVIRFSSIGDIVLTSPVLRCLKEQLPDAEIHFLTKKRFYVLLEFNPTVSTVIPFSDGLFRLVYKLRQEKYDLVIDLHHNLRSFAVKFGLGVPSFSFEKLNLEKWLLVRFKKNLMPNRHIVERYLDTVAPLGVENDGKGLAYYPCSCEEPEKNSIPEVFWQKPYVVASIGGTHATKRMPVAKWVELLKQINVPILICGGKEDRESGSGMETGLLQIGKTVHNACGAFTLGGTAYLIKQAALVISHDTGLMHIAAAYKRPVLAIWGNTVPEFGMYPYKTPFLNLEVRNLACRPCSKIGFSACPEGHFRCMNDLSLEEPVVKAFIEGALASPVTLPN